MLALIRQRSPDHGMQVSFLVYFRSHNGHGLFCLRLRLILQQVSNRDG